MTQPIRHVLWDWNGTLVDDVRASVGAMNELLVARNLPTLSLEQHRATFGFPVQVYYDALGFDWSRETFGDAVADYLQAYTRPLSQATLAPGAREAVEALAFRGVRQSVLSATEQGQLRLQAARFSGLDAIEAWVGQSDASARGKVGRGLAYLEAHGVSAAHTVLVGDTLHDVEVAEALGCRCLLVGIGHQSVPRLRASGAPVCTDLSMVAELLGDAVSARRGCTSVRAGDAGAAGRRRAV
jgi:phosphoglycolate phosphatase